MDIHRRRSSGASRRPRISYAGNSGPWQLSGGRYSCPGPCFDELPHAGTHIFQSIFKHVMSSLGVPMSIGIRPEFNPTFKEVLIETEIFPTPKNKLLLFELTKLAFYFRQSFISAMLFFHWDILHETGHGDAVFP